VGGVKIIELNIVNVLFLLILSNLTTNNIFSQNIIKNFGVSNGTLYSIVPDPDGKKLYIGGSFSKVGPHIGAGVTVDKTTGEYDKNFPIINGRVDAAISDGKGGWYIGGSFNAIDDYPIKNLAHINADNSLDKNWNPNPENSNPSNYIDNIVSYGSTFYVMGQFKKISGEERHFVASYSLSSGQLTDWDPKPDSIVSCLAVSGSTVYVSGTFSNVGGKERYRIAALDISTGNATDWQPNIMAGNSGGNPFFVSSFLPYAKKIYISGNFSNVDGLNRNNIAALDSATGRVTSWDPLAANADKITNIGIGKMLRSGNTIYIVGGINLINVGSPYTDLLAVDATTGIVKNLFIDNRLISAYLIALSDSSIYILGRIVNANSGYGLMRRDTLTGNSTVLNINFNNLVTTLAIAGPRIFIGGIFTSVNGKIQQGAAALDGTNGVLKDWYQNSGGLIYSIATHGKLVYLGGGIDGQTNKNLIAVNDSTGEPSNWNSIINGNVNAIAISNNTIYVGGIFTAAGGQTRNNFAAIDLYTGLATVLDLNPNGYISTIQISGNTLFIGGGFTQIGGKARNGIAAVDLTIGTITDWNPNPTYTFNSAIIKAVLISGNIVYTAGLFDNIGGQQRNNLAAIDIITGNATQWNPSTYGIGSYGGMVRGICIKGNRLYTVGDFSKAGGLDRNFICAINTITGDVTSWNPIIQSDDITDFPAQPVGIRAIGIIGNIVYAANTAISADTTDITDVKTSKLIPTEFSLQQNFPNPFNPTTTINFSIPRSEFVKIKVYDILGKVVVTLINEDKPAGNYSVQLNAGKLVSGVYFYRMEAGTYTQTKKLLFLK